MEKEGMSSGTKLEALENDNKMLKNQTMMLMEDLQGKENELEGIKVKLRFLDRENKLIREDNEKKVKLAVDQEKEITRLYKELESFAATKVKLAVTEKQLMQFGQTAHDIMNEAVQTEPKKVNSQAVETEPDTVLKQKEQLIENLKRLKEENEILRRRVSQRDTHRPITTNPDSSANKEKRVVIDIRPSQNRKNSADDDMIKVTPYKANFSTLQYDSEPSRKGRSGIQSQGSAKGELNKQVLQPTGNLPSVQAAPPATTKPPKETVTEYLADDTAVAKGQKRENSLLKTYEEHSKIGSPDVCEGTLPSVYKDLDSPDKKLEFETSPYGVPPKTAKPSRRPHSRKPDSSGGALSSSLAKRGAGNASLGMYHGVERGSSKDYVSVASIGDGRPRTSSQGMKKLLRVVNLRDIQSK